MEIQDQLALLDLQDLLATPVEQVPQDSQVHQDLPEHLVPKVSQVVMEILEQLVYLVAQDLLEHKASILSKYYSNNYKHQCICIRQFEKFGLN